MHRQIGFFAMSSILGLAACDGVSADAEPGVTTGAITAGQLDGDAHPYVGLSLFGFYTPDHAIKFEWRCSGALISPTRYVTAGHCTYDAGQVPDVAIIFFGPDLTAVRAGLRQGKLVGPFAIGTPRPHPLYDDFAGFPNTHDTGVVDLWVPFEVERYATLAPLGTVDDFLASASQSRFMEAVGYGLQDVGNPVVPDQADWTRGVATEKVLASQSKQSGGWNIQTIDTPRAIPGAVLADPARIPYAAGGTCFGDSGGPQLLAGTDTIVAVTSFGLNNQCAGTGFHYRVDTDTAQGFLLK